MKKSHFTGAIHSKNQIMYKLIQSLAVAGALSVSSLAYSAIDGTYTEDFEGCTQSDLDAIGAITGGTCGAGSAGLSVWGNVFDPAGSWLYGYGLFPAPNNAADPSAQFSGLAGGEGGINQGAQQLNFFNDYNSPEHGLGNTVEADILKEWTSNMVMSMSSTLRSSSMLGGL